MKTPTTFSCNEHGTAVLEGIKDLELSKVGVRPSTSAVIRRALQLLAADSMDEDNKESEEIKKLNDSLHKWFRTEGRLI